MLEPLNRDIRHLIHVFHNHNAFPALAQAANLGFFHKMANCPPAAKPRRRSWLLAAPAGPGLGEPRV